MNTWESYLDGLSESQKKVVINALQMAKKFAPNAIEALPYGVPGLVLNGKPLIAVAAHKEHYGIYPFSPGVIESAKPLIGNHETAKGTIRFKYDDVPSEELVKALIELRSKEIY